VKNRIKARYCCFTLSGKVTVISRFMKMKRNFIFGLPAGILLLCTACSTNNKQQENFRVKALQAPSQIKSMNANGKHPKGSENDVSDWQAAPDFRGLVEVITPAYPNPVSFNSNFRILLNVKALNAINGLTIYAFQQPADLQNHAPVKIYQKTLEPGLLTITLSPQLFARNGGSGNIGNIYRIIFFDGRNRVITYGDVEVR
jgi:hypothetical protein